jgi:hypothetical protein
MNDFARLLHRYCQTEFADRPDLLRGGAELPPGASGCCATTASGPHPQARQRAPLSTDADRAITPTGIVTADGDEHEVDVIIYAPASRRRSSSRRCR